ncbi:unnamed protein product [Urochloa humidicola]
MGPPPSLIQPGSPVHEIRTQSAFVRAVAHGDYTAACRAQWGAAAGAPTSGLPMAPSAATDVQAVAGVPGSVFHPTATPPPATAPTATRDVPLPGVSAGSADPLHHTTTLTPPATVPPGALQTPDATQLIYPDQNINPLLVPRLRQEFPSMEAAHEFYRDYAKLAGFSVTTARTSKETRHWLCYRAGVHKSKKEDGEPRLTEKGSRKCGCPAYVKLKEDKKRNLWYFDHVHEAHNHKLEPSPRMTRYMHAHKRLDESISDIFNIMTRNGVAHQAALHVMSDLHQGRHMWDFTEKDIKNKKAEMAREERDDDLYKLLEFFRECKRNNEYFYWDIEADPKTGVVRNIFWSHASQRAEYRDFGDVITFDTTHKTNSKNMPLAMFVGASNNLKNVTFGQALVRDESTESFKWLFESFLSCMAGRQPHVILTDEDPAMRQAIAMVFEKSQHRNCRWHITRPWEYDLDQLYSQHKDKNLKERFESLINYPLGPTQFEVEWMNLIDECGIADHPAIRALWDKRQRWIATYFKGIYCGRMTLTQRSESQNRVLKDGYVGVSTSLHMFAKRMLDSLQHADHMDAGETHYSQAEVVRACKAKFDEQLSRVYTRAVYQEYKKEYNNSTAFVIRPNPDPAVKNGWLIKHESGEGSFCWAQHEFKVIADKEAGEYSCECKQWDHTGLFCMHIIRAFTHLQVRRIPEKYILKRYTRDAREDVEWDRHDGVRIGGRASKEQTRLAKLLPKLMRLGRVGSRSDRAFEETNRLIDKITPGVEMFPRTADGELSENGQAASGSIAPGSTDEPGPSGLLHDGMMLIDPPTSRTKGRSSGKQKKVAVEDEIIGNPLSTYAKENYGNKECSECGVRGTHYCTTCPWNPDRSNASGPRTKKRGAKTKHDGPPRKRGRPKIIRDLHEESVLIPSEAAASQESNYANRGGGASVATRGRGARRTQRANYQE